MLRWLDDLPWLYLVVAMLTLGLAPFVPEPHLWEKLRWLAQGQLSRPLDIFDLCLHGSPFVLAALKGGRRLSASNNHNGSDSIEVNHTDNTHTHNSSDSGSSRRSD